MESIHLSRRAFAASLTFVGATVVPELIADASADTGTGPDLNLPEEPVDVTVEIVWLPDGAPVEGASVFRHPNNELFGRTGKDGMFITQLPNGTLLRLVEPTYGQQQALRVVQGERRPNRGIRVSRLGEGWTLP